MDEMPSAAVGTDPSQYIKSVFSTKQKSKIGTGTTSRRVIQKTYWYVEQVGEDDFICQPINANYVPSGAKRHISREDLLDMYDPEPEFYMTSVRPSMGRELEKHIGKGDVLRKKNSNFAAEFSYKNALDIDEDNIRANFGIGLTYLQRGDTDRAASVFDRLVGLKEAFQPEHKHLFNEFGIQLRKNSMLQQAAEYYGKALELSSADDNLHLNLARVFCEQKQYDRCTKEVIEALKINPANPAARKFIVWLQRSNLLSAELVPQLVAALKAAAAKQQG